MAKQLPEIGQGVRFRGPVIRGTGEVVAVLPANEPLSQEAVMLYYGIAPQEGGEDPGEAYSRAARAIGVERIVMLRDDMRRHLIIPPGLFDPRLVELIDSPRCPQCNRLSPAQKWADKCPKCGFEHQPEVKLA